MILVNQRISKKLNSNKMTRNIKILINIGINIRLLTAELLKALAWHRRSSGNISKNGISLPVCGSVQVFFLARCN